MIDNRIYCSICGESTYDFIAWAYPMERRWKWSTNWETNLSTCPRCNRVRHCKEIEVPYNKHFERSAA